MKSALKLLVFFGIGCLIGIVLVCAGIVSFTDMTWNELVQKLAKIEALEVVGIFAGSIVCTLVAFILQIVLHEGGHLLFGLLSGYRFVSFRIFNWTLIRQEGKFRLKRFGIAGTGGQCLMLPPDKPLEEIPGVLYHWGGVIVNMSVALLAFVVWYVVEDPSLLLAQFLVMMCFAGVSLGLLNGIPFKRGITNDAANVRLMRKYPKSKKAMIVQLRVNACIQEGIRIKDMPEEWFAWVDDIDYGEPMQLNIRLLQVGRLLDLGQMEEAYVALEEIARHKGEMIGLLAKEVVCELIYLDLVTGHNRWADTLYTKEIELYVRQYRVLMSSKQRFLCAWALYKERDREKALAIYKNVVQKQTQYLLQGEVKMDIAMMEAMFHPA